MEWVHGAMQKDSFHTLNKKSHVYSLTYLSIFVQDAQKGDKSCSSSCLFFVSVSGQRPECKIKHMRGAN